MQAWRTGEEQQAVAVVEEVAVGQAGNCEAVPERDAEHVQQRGAHQRRHIHQPVLSGKNFRVL